MKLPKPVADKLQQRTAANALRHLPKATNLVDFSSNDYLGFAASEAIFKATHAMLVDRGFTQNGATGSRLLSGNHPVYPLAETAIAQFHQAETALLFNSGYDANIGFFSALPQRGDLIVYDELCHASIRDGIRMSHAKSLRFAHNDNEQLRALLESHSHQYTTVYIATESVFSMDGDSPNLSELCAIAEQYKAYLVVDEAHALGVCGARGEGLVQSLQLTDRVFARIMTFGKGLGCHGAAILGSTDLQAALINFARSFVYTTGLSPHAVATIRMAYQHLENHPEIVLQLQEKIKLFHQEIQLLGLHAVFANSNLAYGQSGSAIQCAIIPGNTKVKAIAQALQDAGFEVKPILSPTVPEGQERLRFCLHAYNSDAELRAVLHGLQQGLMASD